MVMLAAFLGGWEIVLILAVVLLMGMGVAAAVIIIAVMLWRQQKQSTRAISMENQRGNNTEEL
jgi:heme A synthase